MADMSIGRLYTVLPDAIPADHLVTRWACKHPLCAAALDQERPTQDATTTFEITARLNDAIAQIPFWGTPLENPDGQPDDLAHDAFFHVRRVEQDSPGVFVRAILSARLLFLNEVMAAEVTISTDHLDLIDRGFADLLSCLFRGGVNELPSVTKWHLCGETCDPMQRWVHGHLVFAALTQGLILSFRSLGQAFRAGKTEDIHKWADLSISLLKASGAAFVFTGDFAPGEYENTIRPSMTPPISAIGLSGLMSADHRYMAQTIRDMRPVLKALADHEPERHDRIAEAINGVYDSHIHVCERFVGARPSILTAGRTERSGPSLIEQFKTLRLKPFEHTARTSRLTNEHTASSAIGECPFKRG